MPRRILTYARRASKNMSGHRRRNAFKRRMFAGGKCYCAWCCEELTLKLCTIDHATALTLNGRDVPSNYLLACSLCNKQRGKEITIERQSLKLNCFQCHQSHSKRPCPLTIKEQDHARTHQ